MVRLRTVSFAVLVLAVVGLSQDQSKKSAPSDQFQEQVAAYLKLRKMVADQLPKLKPTPSAQELADRQARLASSLAKARAGVMQGNIFTPEVATEFRRLAELALDGSDGARVHKSLKRSEPVKGTVGVNQAYPPAVPLQTMPPTLLMGLPKLPMELEYRLVGRTLILRDGEANLIIDFLPEAIP
ncbi:MAG: hypothetical protein JWO19_3738 [Bryobacterales bacterium]|nr:hypothetical protein [Bryobacterales bacterium]